MDIISTYSDTEGSSRGLPQATDAAADPESKLLQVAVSAAPAVETTGLVLVDNKAVPVGDALFLQPSTARMVKYNLPIQQMHAPVVGPANPNDRAGVAGGLRNHWSGHAEDAHLNSFTFDEQYHTFHSYGYAADPGGTGATLRASVGKATVPPALGSSVYSAGIGSRAEASAKRQKTAGAAVAEGRAAKAPVGSNFDPSAPAFVLTARQPWAAKEAEAVELTDEQREYIAAVKQDKAVKEASEGKAEHTIFHGKEERDFQGRSWIESPKDLRSAASEACFLPKRCVHTWSGHTKGVNTVRFFPETGHLLLSAGLDGAVKVWDVTGDRRCMRTYLGHAKGVRDAWFSHDGRRFVTAAYDKTIKMWDTETGAVLGKYGEGQMAYTVRLHPSPDQPDVLMAGMQNKKILQFDLRTADIVQEYNYHLGAVNTVTFVDENRRFVSTSDDKTIRVWEFGIPVQVKYIADPSMHAISTTALSHSGKWWIGQSADNQILTYSANDRVRPNRKKTFKGHSSAGYACQVAFSHDDHYVISGDGEGKLFVWDWKTTKILRSLKAHEGVSIGAEWHPTESSKVATCGWDGLIKYWD